MFVIKALIVAMAVMSAAAQTANETEIPVLPETWWGPGEATEVDESIIPFTINFTDEIIEDLRIRLNNTRALHPALENAFWSYGIDGAYVPTILDYWMNDYDFAARQDYLNQYPQYTTNIQGLDIHFLHVVPEDAQGKRVLPLIIQHGFFGSIIEFYKIIPMLTTPRDEYDFVFEVIAPSLPGFGFSSGTVRPGMGSPEMAVILKNLMLRLGFEQFYAQGGDFGSITFSNMAVLFPENVLGFHTNFCLVLTPLTALKLILYNEYPSTQLTEDDYTRMLPLERRWSGLMDSTGYLHMQATKPDTLGLSLTDSPAGLAAYLIEKFSKAANPANNFYSDGNLQAYYTFDELLDDVMVYWINRSVTTAMRLYAESFNWRFLDGLEGLPITVPSACAIYPNEMVFQPEDIVRERFINLLRFTRMPRGGHFAAFLEPETLSEDIWASIDEMETLRQ